jgi:hypothetical protein
MLFQITRNGARTQPSGHPGGEYLLVQDENRLCCYGLPLQVRTASCAGTACLNSFGDEQLAVDMVADKLLFEALQYSVSSSSSSSSNSKCG